MEKNIQVKKLRRLVWMGSGVAFIVIVAAVAASFLLYQRTSALFIENLRDRLLTISITEASNISASDINSLQVEDDYKKPEWSRVVNALHAAKYTNKNIVYMYIFRKQASNPKQMEYVADADSIDPFANTDTNPNNNVDVNGDGKVDPEDADKLQWPSQPYPEAVDYPEAFEAYNGPLTVHDLYTDAFGTVLTGYAPIKDVNGNTVAILATDIKASDYFNEAQQTLYPFLLFIAFLISIISVLAFFLIFLWERQAESLAELDRLKSEFLSVATHQLRAPLTAIKGYLANMSDGTYGPVPAYLVEPLGVAQESARVMTSSIEDYLNVSRIQQGRMKYEFMDTDLTVMAKRTVQELQLVAKQKGLYLTMPETPTITAKVDPGKIKQVFTNLMDNAIKYTEKGGITVTLEQRPTTARFMVSDTGVGIPEEEIGKLFSKFIRARGANKVNTTGTGLGLYVAKQLVEGHNGKVWAESDGEGKGSRFIVELPLATTAPATPAAVA